MSWIVIDQMFKFMIETETVINVQKQGFSDLIHISHLLQSICYFLLALGLELLPFNKLTLATLKEWWKSIKSIHPGTSSYLEPLLTSSAEAVTLDLDEDTDVKTERTRVLSGSIDNAIIYLCNLRKVLLYLL